MLGAVFRDLLHSFCRRMPSLTAFQQINLGIDKLTGNAQTEVNKEIEKHNNYARKLKEEEDYSLKTMLVVQHQLVLQISRVV